MIDRDPRPTAAIGHATLKATDVGAAAARLEAVGMRSIVKRDAVAILELRGGTHIVLRELPGPDEFEAQFDLMFDDIQAAHTQFRDAGFAVTEIETGRIHESFDATAPERFSLRVVDSHSGDRVV